MTFSTIAWGWPQWTLFVLMVLSLIMNAFDHGKPRTPHNFPVCFVNFLLSALLLTAGGFFS